MDKIGASKYGDLDDDESDRLCREYSSEIDELLKDYPKDAPRWHRSELIAYARTKRLVKKTLKTGKPYRARKRKYR